MEEKLTFKATIDEENILRIEYDGKTVSQKEVTRKGQKSSFTIKGEKIDWIVDVRPQWSNSLANMFVYFYPINLNYAENPVEVEQR